MRLVVAYDGGRSPGCAAAGPANRPRAGPPWRGWPGAAGADRRARADRRRGACQGTGRPCRRAAAAGPRAGAAGPERRAGSGHRGAKADWAPPGFRRPAVGPWRTYVYRVDDSGDPDPLVRGFVLAWPGRSTCPCARVLAPAGEHDFAAFCRSRSGATTTRRLRSLGIRRLRGLVGPGWSPTRSAGRMVRGIVGHLLLVGDGRRDAARSRSCGTATARRQHRPAARPRPRGGELRPQVGGAVDVDHTAPVRDSVPGVARKTTTGDFLPGMRRSSRGSGRGWRRRRARPGTGRPCRSPHTRATVCVDPVRAERARCMDCPRLLRPALLA